MGSKKMGGLYVARIPTISKSKQSKVKPRFIVGEDLEQVTKPELHKNKQSIKRRCKGMKREILIFIEDLKDLREECVEHCEATCYDKNLSHEGKVAQIEHNVAELKKWADEKCMDITKKLNKKIEMLNSEEAAELKRKRESNEYNTRLTSMSELLKKTANSLTDEEIRISLEQFENDPIAIAVFREMFGLERMGVLPEDNRGKRQELLQSVINFVQNSVDALTNVKYQEDAFPGAFLANEFYLSQGVILMFDMNFIESLNDDCTGKLSKEPEREEKPEFKVDFVGVR